jgi:hypothetical protein
MLILAQGAWFGFVVAGTYSEHVGLLVWISPFVAALVTAYLSPT